MLNRKVINFGIEFIVVKEMFKRCEEKKIFYGDKNSVRILNRVDFKREMKNYIYLSDVWWVRCKLWNKLCESFLWYYVIKYVKCLRIWKIWVSLFDLIFW